MKKIFVMIITVILTMVCTQTHAQRGKGVLYLKVKKSGMKVPYTKADLDEAFENNLGGFGDEIELSNGKKIEVGIKINNLHSKRVAMGGPFLPKEWVNSKTGLFFDPTFTKKGDYVIRGNKRFIQLQISKSEIMRRLCAVINDYANRDGWIKEVGKCTEKNIYWILRNSEIVQRYYPKGALKVGIVQGTEIKYWKRDSYTLSSLDKRAEGPLYNEFRTRWVDINEDGVRDTLETYLAFNPTKIFGLKKQYPTRVYLSTFCFNEVIEVEDYTPPAIEEEEPVIVQRTEVVEPEPVVVNESEGSTTVVYRNDCCDTVIVNVHIHNNQQPAQQVVQQAPQQIVQPIPQYQKEATIYGPVVTGPIPGGTPMYYASAPQCYYHNMYHTNPCSRGGISFRVGFGWRYNAGNYYGYRGCNGSYPNWKVPTIYGNNATYYGHRSSRSSNRCATQGYKSYKGYNSRGSVAYSQPGYNSGGGYNTAPRSSGYSGGRSRSGGYNTSGGSVRTF